MSNTTDQTTTKVTYRDFLNPTTHYPMTVQRIVGPTDPVESYEQHSVDRARERGGDDGNVLVGIVGYQLHAIHESEVVR